VWREKLCLHFSAYPLTIFARKYRSLQFTSPSDPTSHRTARIYQCLNQRAPPPQHREYLSELLISHLSHLVTPSPDNWRSGLRAPPRDDRPQTEDVKATKGLEFEDMFLRRELLMGIFEAGFEKPSPIQEEAIPVALTKRDILARAKNGTGKTAAFVIPALQHIDVTTNKIQALLLVPTRELALQTSQVCKNLGKHMNTQVMVTTGGTTLKDDILRLSEIVHVLVGTPGRILDLAGKNIADLSECPVFVMDEADKLLSPEFSPVMEQLLSYLPRTRQVMLFSATFPLIVKDFKVRHHLPCPPYHQLNAKIGQTYEHST
jgi:ATP-dependent RNA helicase DDX6/DHH1